MYTKEQLIKQCENSITAAKKGIEKAVSDLQKTFNTGDKGLIILGIQSANKVIESYNEIITENEVIIDNLKMLK